jgi:hypothetical protein
LHNISKVQGVTHGNDTLEVLKHTSFIFVSNLKIA